jgi:hypothetical protein
MYVSELILGSFKYIPVALVTRLDHVHSYKTDIYKKNATNMGTKLYNKMPGYIKEMDNCKALNKVEIISFIHCFLLSGGLCLFVIYNV